MTKNKISIICVIISCLSFLSGFFVVLYEFITTLKRNIKELKQRFFDRDQSCNEGS